MDMAIPFGDHHQTRVAIGGEEDPRSPRLRWQALVIAFGIGATLLWAGTLLWLVSWMLFFVVARYPWR